jgi:glycosyltransferase involved in cell wall biosynthesis
VSVGIPTYNRAERLRRAAESVLAQTHGNIDLVISDDGSTDRTGEVLRELAQRDARVRLLNAPANRGLSANFNVVYGALTGDYVMTLSDDDWLAPDYVERCLGALSGDVVLACGAARYVDGTTTVRTGRLASFVSDAPSARVLDFLREVDENGMLSGLMPRAVLTRASPMRNVLANDWLVVASILVQGKAVTLGQTSLYRDVGGTSASIRKLVATLGLPSWQARIPHLVFAWEVAAEIANRGPAFAVLPPLQRGRLAARAGLAAINWRSLAWHAAGR